MANESSSHLIQTALQPYDIGLTTSVKRPGNTSRPSFLLIILSDNQIFQVTAAQLTCRSACLRVRLVWKMIYH